MTTIAVSPLAPAERPDYTHFVSQHPCARFAHDLTWADALQDTYGFRVEHLVARDDNGIVGVVPLFFSRSLLLVGTHYSTCPFPSYAAPLYASPAALNAVLRATAEKTSAVRYTHLPTGEPLPLSPTDWQLHPRVDDLTFLLPLGPDPDQIHASLAKNLRRDIRNAEKRGVEIVVDTAGTWQEEFYQLYASTYASKHGLPPHPRSLFRNLWRNLPPGGLRVFFARHERRMIAAVMTLWAHGEIYYAWAAAESASSALQPTTAALWRAIHQGCSEGYRVFNMGEAPKAHEGLVKFKTRWCPVVQDTYSYYLLGRAKVPPAHYYDSFGWQKKLVAALPLSVTTRVLSPLLRFVL